MLWGILNKETCKTYAKIVWYALNKYRLVLWTKFKNFENKILSYARILKIPQNVIYILSLASVYVQN